MLRFLVLCLLTWAAAAADRWELQFFHDKDDSELVLNDIAFATPVRGIAAGALVEKGRVKPLAMVTTNGGQDWTMVPVREVAISLFVLDESSAWMVTERGVWFSDEGGRAWRKILRRDGLLRVHFASRERGWAIGARKTVLETQDAGKTWKPAPGLDSVKTSDQFTTFQAIAFAGKRGIIAGRSRPPRRGERWPLWMDPEAEQRRERPNLTLVLESRDGGATWTSATTSVFGAITALEMDQKGQGLALFEFENLFSVPSELVRIDLATGKSAPIFRSDRRAITDVAVTGGGAFAAGYEPAGKVTRSPVPGRVRILSTTDLDRWAEAEVDYRAVARRVSLAAIDADHAWAATDTGMILRLQRR